MSCCSDLTSLHIESRVCKGICNRARRNSAEIEWLENVTERKMVRKARTLAKLQLLLLCRPMQKRQTSGIDDSNGVAHSWALLGSARWKAPAALKQR